MTSVYADTSFFIALLNASDAMHAEALGFSQVFQGKLVTSEYILIELGNFLSRLPARRLFAGFVAHIRVQPGHVVVECTSEILQEGIDLYARRCDKEWSLVDCISFAIMRRLGLRAVLTADHHFEQAGFEIVRSP